jgi:hypothetical protein
MPHIRRDGLTGFGRRTAEPISRKPSDDPSGDDGMSNGWYVFRLAAEIGRQQLG